MGFQRIFAFGFVLYSVGLLCIALAQGGDGDFEEDEWGEMVNCSEGKFVVGFQLRVDFRDPLQQDNTGLNGIWFACGNGHEPEDAEDEGRKFEWITSATSPYGQFQRRLFCGKGVEAKGFQLKVQTDGVEDQAGRDNVGAVNLNMICGDGEQVEGYEEKAGYEFLDAEYLEAMRCPAEEEVVCGLQTKVEEFKWNGDNSALKDLRIRCCSKNGN